MEDIQKDVFLIKMKVLVLNNCLPCSSYKIHESRDHVSVLKAYVSSS